ncbi:MAG: M56 family metallopeptidase [Acidobacteria bacterium]|nr:M56 family metallopeptidase [Acidobacteriota bacterium]MBV9070660.1 M56 family metallopeptidase [Acidobacteriota bacterium]MBV9478153.1 M56 family metallopeptidase [Acidobacteriota bacterium]
MIVASTLVALPLLAVALVARRFRSDLEEAAWRLMALALLVTPFVTLLPKVDIGFRLPLLSADPTLPFRSQPQLPTDDSFPTIAFVYAAIALTLFARLAFAANAARRLRRNARPFGEAYLADALRVPVTAGLVSPAILLPPYAPAWSDEKLAAILAHERAHVARRDPLWRCIGRAAAALCWFHPLAWLASAAIERIAEETADREAIATTGDRHAYASVILEFVRTMTGTRCRALASGILDGRALSPRIDAILASPKRRRSRLITRLALALLVAGAIFTTAMTDEEYPPPPYAAAQLHQQQQQSNEEFFRMRDELRARFRETVRNTTRNFFRGLFR